MSDGRMTSRLRSAARIGHSGNHRGGPASFIPKVGRMHNIPRFVSLAATLNGFSKPTMHVTTTWIFKGFL